MVTDTVMLGFVIKNTCPTEQSPYISITSSQEGNPAYLRENNDFVRWGIDSRREKLSWLIEKK